jgi:hypothetical protein
MDQTVFRQFDNLLNALVVGGFSTGEAFDLSHGIGSNQVHADAVSVGFQWNGCRESMLVQSLHECKFFERGNTRHVQPTGVSTLEVISVVLNGPKRCSSQTREFNYN